ncbi:MAG: hypothetical protein AAF337_11095, partial [Pseudomonadota bacterium]
EKAASEPPTAQQSPRLLPFNVLVSRARAFQKNQMLTGAYIEECITKLKLAETEAALTVLSDMTRADVRAALLTSAETLLGLEQKCQLAPGTLTSNADAIKRQYRRPA